MRPFFEVYAEVYANIVYLARFMFPSERPPKNMLGCNLLYFGALQPNFNM